MMIGIGMTWMIRPTTKTKMMQEVSPLPAAPAWSLWQSWPSPRPTSQSGICPGSQRLAGFGPAHFLYGVRYSKGWVQRKIIRIHENLLLHRFGWFRASFHFNCLFKVWKSNKIRLSGGNPVSSLTQRAGFCRPAKREILPKVLNFKGALRLEYEELKWPSNTHI